jgi:hypothetical protein
MGWETLQAGVFWRNDNKDSRHAQLDALRSSAWLEDLGAVTKGEIKWGYVQLQDRCLLTIAGVDRVKELSLERPLLFFFSTDDFICEKENEEMDFDGWGFRIFVGGSEKAHLEFSYAWPSYGEELRATIASTVNTLDISLFDHFSLGEERLRKLNNLLDAEQLYTKLEDESTLEDIEYEFVSILNIESLFFLAR